MEGWRGWDVIKEEAAGGRCRGDGPRAEMEGRGPARNDCAGLFEEGTEPLPCEAEEQQPEEDDVGGDGAATKEEEEHEGGRRVPVLGCWHPLVFVLEGGCEGGWKAEEGRKEGRWLGARLEDGVSKPGELLGGAKEPGELEACVESTD